VDLHGNTIDLRKLLAHSLFQPNLIVLVANQVETRRMIRKCALDEEGVRSDSAGRRDRGIGRHRRAGAAESGSRQQRNHETMPSDAVHCGRRKKEMTRQKYY